MSHHHEGCCKHEGQPRHEGCCKGEKSEHEHCGHGHQHEHGQSCGRRHGRGGGRRQRFFGHGELRLVILDILSRDDSHGYELIKAIENLTQGNYTPSPGVIYPTLDFLQEQSLITIREEEGGKKQIALTEQGAQWLEENREQVEMIEERIKARCVGAALRQNPQMKRALDNFKAVLDLRVNQSDISDAQIKKIIAVIDRAAFDITQLDESPIAGCGLPYTPRRPDNMRQPRIRHCAPTAGSGIPINAVPSPRLPVGWRGVSPSPTPALSLPPARHFSVRSG